METAPFDVRSLKSYRRLLRLFLRDLQAVQYAPTSPPLDYYDGLYFKRADAPSWARSLYVPKEGNRPHGIASSIVASWLPLSRAEEIIGREARARYGSACKVSKLDIYRAFNDDLTPVTVPMADAMEQMCKERPDLIRAGNERACRHQLTLAIWRAMDYLDRETILKIASEIEPYKGDRFRI